MTQNPNDESLPTQNIPADSEIFNSDSRDATPEFIPTSKLIIVSFYLPGRSDPIIVTGAKTITIGRRDPKRRINPTIDLTEDQGAKLGVSRMHAEMNFVNGKYYLKDTGSSNGTWVNDTKLQSYQPHPVLTGDQVRIGQVAIVLHLSLPQRDNSLDAISTVIDEGYVTDTQSYKLLDNTGGILVENNAIVVSKLRPLSTYLERLDRIHNIIREAQQQEKSIFSVVAIRVRTVDNALIIDVSNGNDLMDFMAEKLSDFVAVIEGKQEGTKKQTDSLQRYPQPLEQIADYALQELVFRFLNESRDEYVMKLATHFDAILASDLSLKKTSN
ncbi:MAG: hypothetical protein Phog2KO_21010 [Phototrophicaceae bacterium]